MNDNLTQQISCIQGYRYVSAPSLISNQILAKEMCQFET